MGEQAGECSGGRILASRMAPAWLLPSCLCPQRQPGPFSALLHPCGVLLGGFPACSCYDHPGPTFRPDPVSPQPPTVPGSLLPPHPAHILAQRLPPPFLLCLQWPQPFPPGEGRLGPWDLHGPDPSRCDPDSAGTQPHRRADVSSLRAGMKGWFLASLQGRRNSHRFAPSLSLLRGGVTAAVAAACLGRQWLWRRTGLSDSSPLAPQETLPGLCPGSERDGRR